MKEPSSDSSISTISDITVFNPSTVETPEPQTTEETRSGSSESNTFSVPPPATEDSEEIPPAPVSTPAEQSTPENTPTVQGTQVILEKIQERRVETVITSQTQENGAEGIDTNISVVTKKQQSTYYEKKENREKKSQRKTSSRTYTAQRFVDKFKALKALRRENFALTIPTLGTPGEAAKRERELQETLARNRRTAKLNAIMNQIDSEFYATNSKLNLTTYEDLLKASGAEGSSLDARVKLATRYAQGNKELTPVIGQPRSAISAIEPLQTPLVFALMLDNQQVIDPLEVPNYSMTDADRIMQAGIPPQDDGYWDGCPFGDEITTHPDVSEVLAGEHIPPPFPVPAGPAGAGNYNLEYHTPISPSTGATKKHQQSPQMTPGTVATEPEAPTRAFLVPMIRSVNELIHSTNALIEKVDCSDAQHKEYQDIIAKHTVAIEVLQGSVQHVQDELAGVRQAITSLERRFETQLQLGSLQSSRPTAPGMSAHPGVSNAKPALKPIPAKFDEAISWFMKKSQLPETYRGILGALLSYADIRDIQELVKKTGLPITANEVQFLAGFELRERQREKVDILMSMIEKWKIAIRNNVVPHHTGEF